MASKTVSTRFLVISDTHDFEFKNSRGPFRLPMPKIDVVLHCGDLTNVGGSSAFKNALRMLGAINAETKLIIAGNHDLDLKGTLSSSLHFALARFCWSVVRMLTPAFFKGQRILEDLVTRRRQRRRDRKRALRRSRYFDGNHDRASGGRCGSDLPRGGTHTFTLQNGATFKIYASPYQPEFNNWAFGYEHTKDRFNLPEQVGKGITSIAQNPIPDFPGVDIVMTHGPPKGILDLCPDGNKGCNNLLRAVGRAKPRLHCFGHIYEGYGAKRVTWQNGEETPQGNNFPEDQGFSVEFGKETLMVNAAIRNEGMDASNAPWVVELELPLTVHHD